MRSRLSALLVTALVGVLLVACGTTPQSTDSTPTVLVTTSIWADVVENVACDQALTVDLLIPPGVDPHGFEPSLADRERMDSAALIVANGLSLEEGLDDTIDASAGRGTPVFRFSEHLDRSTMVGSDVDGHDLGDDPHIWFDPKLVASALPALAADLTENAGLDPATTESCMSDYQRTLDELHEDVERIVGAVPEGRRKLVTSHDSLAYFAARYGFDVIGTVIPAASTLAETNPAQLESLAELIEVNEVPAIFAESLQATDDADALARRVGAVEVVILDTGTLGPAGGGADSYVGFVRTTAELISNALR